MACKTQQKIIDRPIHQSMSGPPHVTEIRQQKNSTVLCAVASLRPRPHWPRTARRRAPRKKQAKPNANNNNQQADQWSHKQQSPMPTTNNQSSGYTHHHNNWPTPAAIQQPLSNGTKTTKINSRIDKKRSLPNAGRVGGPLSNTYE